MFFNTRKAYVITFSSSIKCLLKKKTTLKIIKIEALVYIAVSK